MFKYKRTTTDRLVIKGTLSDDCSTISYTDDDKEDQVVMVEDLLNSFSGCPVEMTIVLKSEDDLDVVPMSNTANSEIVEDEIKEDEIAKEEIETEDESEEDEVPTED